MEAVLPSVFNGVGIVALLAFTYFLLTKDHLVTGGSHRRELGMKDEVIGLLKETISRQDGALATKDRAIDSLTASVAKLTITGDTAAHALTDVARMAAERTDDPTGSDS